MGQDDPPNYDEATLVEVPLNGLEPLKHLAAFQVRFSAYATFTDARVGLAFVEVVLGQEFDHDRRTCARFGVIIKATFTRIYSHPPPSPGTNRESRPHARSRLAVDVKARKRI